MMRFILTFLTTLFVIEAFGQVLPQYYDTLERNMEISLTGFGDYSASAVRNDISTKFIHGGMIDEATKDNSFNKHKAVNRVGGDIGTELTYINYSKKLFSKRNLGYMIKAGANYFGGSVYSRDFFGLVFYGNERYFGDTIDLSGTDVVYTAFQKIGFGLIDPKRKSSLSFNLYNISDRMKVINRDLRLIQDADSMQMELIMDGEVLMKNNLKFNQGIGLGFDFTYNLPITWESGKTSFFQLAARNIGFAYMYENQKRYRYDTTFHYDGLSFSEITGDNSILSDSLDYLDTLGISSGMANYTFVLPGMVQIAKIVDDHSEARVQSFYGIRMYPTLIYTPYLFAGADYRPADWLNIGAMLSYGGFCGFKGGLYLSARKNRFSLGIASENITGFFMDSANGQSLYINLRCEL